MCVRMHDKSDLRRLQVEISRISKIHRYIHTHIQVHIHTYIYA